MSRRALLSIAILPFVVACGAADTEEATGEGPSTLSGSIALTSYTLDNPVVIARTARGTSYVAPVARDGRFALVLPSTDHYRVLLASTRANGSFRAVSEIRWGASQASWGSFVKAGATLDVGLVHPIGERGVAVKSSGSGSGGSGGGKDDDSKTESKSESESEDESESESNDCYKAGRADLPYNWNLSVGRTVRLADAFLEKGAPAKAIMSVTMEGTPWHLTELQTGASITVTQADCDHEGNHGTGRDRIVLTWENADGSKETDHMTIRWCDGGGGGGGGGGGSKSSSASTGECKGDEGGACGDSSTGKSSCDGGSMKPEDGAAEPLPVCPPGGDTPAGGTPGGSSTGGADGAVPGSGTPAGGGAASAPANDLPAGGGNGRAGSACVTSADCGPSLACFASTCTTTLR